VGDGAESGGDEDRAGKAEHAIPVSDIRGGLFPAPQKTLENGRSAMNPGRLTSAGADGDAGGLQ
jgi:hypothetical protein